MPWQGQSSIPACRKPRYLLSQRQLQRIAAARRRDRTKMSQHTNIELATIFESDHENSNKESHNNGSTDILENRSEELLPNRTAQLNSFCSNLSTPDALQSLPVDQVESDNRSRPETEEIPERSATFRDILASCFVENNISNTAIDKILAVLRMHECLSYLPKSARALLQTPRRAPELRIVEPGEYLHLGVETAIIKILNGVKMDSLLSRLEIDFSTDGASIDQSGRNQMWPIQCRIANVYPSRTELIGVYRGNKKPNSAMEFFQDFIEETKKIIAAGGVIFNGKRIPMILRCFIADAPAGAFVLNHMGHMSYRPCLKCKVEGYSVDRHMSYKGTEHEPRTDEEYSSMLDEDHHKGPSPLSLLQMGLVSQVPFDYLHLICIGVLKKMLLQLSTGKFSMVSKLSAHQIRKISNRLEIIGRYYPREMARCPLTFEDLRIKATQGRQFLLYNGPVVLYGIVSGEIYEHFLLLHAAMRALIKPSQPEIFYKFASLALSLFVRKCPALYGDRFMSYNIHGLLHVVDDVKRFGPPDHYSAFPYENNIRILKKYCRKPNLTLQQIANRRAEQVYEIGSLQRNENVRVKVSGEHRMGPLPINTVSNIRQYRRLQSANHTLTRNKRDNCVILKNNCICLVRNIVVVGTTEYLVIAKFACIEEFYDVGLTSTLLGFFKCSALQDDLLLVPYTDVQSKGYLMPYWDPCDFDTITEQPIADNYIVGSMSNTVFY